MQKHRFTHHALVRFKERFKSRVENGDVAASFSRVFYRSKDCNSIYNNTRFMTHCYETYGYDTKPVFKVFENMLFICKKEVVTTVINVDHSGFFSNMVIGKYHKRFRN